MTATDARIDERDLELFRVVANLDEMVPIIDRARARILEEGSAR